MSNLKFKIKNLKFRSERGVTILLTLIVLSIVLATAVAASGVVAFQILLAGDVSNSIAAIAAADAGVEWQLYNLRNAVNDDPADFMLFQNGLANYNPIKVVDNDTSTVGWNAGSAVGGWLAMDVGAGGKNYIKARVFLSLAGDAGSYKVQYSDDDISYSDVATLNLSAALGGWNTVAWSDVGSHQYWRFLISAGGSPTININELEMYPAALWSGMSNGATFTTSVVWGSPTILESLGVYKTAKRKFRLTF